MVLIIFFYTLQMQGKKETGREVPAQQWQWCRGPCSPHLCRTVGGHSGSSAVGLSLYRDFLREGKGSE